MFYHGERGLGHIPYVRVLEGREVSIFGDHHYLILQGVVDRAELVVDSVSLHVL